MEFKPVDLPELMGILVGGMTVLIPIMGLTLRYAVKPVLDALISAGVLNTATLGSDAQLGRLQRRVLELEQELDKLKPAALPEPLAPIENDAAPSEQRRVRS